MKILEITKAFPTDNKPVTVRIKTVFHEKYYVRTRLLFSILLRLINAEAIKDGRLDNNLLIIPYRRLMHYGDYTSIKGAGWCFEEGMKALESLRIKIGDNGVFHNPFLCYMTKNASGYVWLNTAINWKYMTESFFKTFYNEMFGKPNKRIQDRMKSSYGK